MKRDLTDKNPYRSYGWTNEQKIEILKRPNRIASLIDPSFVGSVMATFCANGILNTKASSKKYGLVIYPK